MNGRQIGGSIETTPFANDKGSSIFAEGTRRESGIIELAVDEGRKGGWSEGVDLCGVGGAVFEVGMVAELEGGVKLGLADEDEVVIFGEVF